MTGTVITSASPLMLLVVLACFAGAAAAPLLMRGNAARPALLLALLPATLLALLVAVHGGAVAAGATVIEARPWISGLSVAASFRLDGLSLLMAGLILGIGTLVVAYAGSYLGDDPRAGRFFVYLLSFMGAMLGLVLADNILLLFVFWELTSVTSFLLIGYNHEEEKARKNAFQGFFITVAGGLVMLAGIVALGEAVGSYELSTILATEDVHQHPVAGLALALIVIGCFTKSAQFPFHFWLPNAMAAPTPVSAYLHSATMVKAGVYLLARLHPAFGEHAHWFWWLVPAGGLTMVLGAVLAFRSTGLKAILAYTTVMALGTLTMLLGIGEAGAAVTFLLAHALYKGALFLVAGIIDHEAGGKDLRDIGGLGSKLPVTASAALIAVLSAAGLPPLFGFIGKEMLLEYGLDASTAVAAASVLAAGFVTAMVATLWLRAFTGGFRAKREHVHEAPWPLLAGPVLLGLGSIGFGLVPGLAEAGVLQAAAMAVGAAPDAALGLKLWHGFNLPLLLSGLSLGLGAALYLAWPRLQPGFASWTGPERYGPEAQYERGMQALASISDWQTRTLQSGYLRNYVMIVLLVVLGVVGGTLLLRAGLSLPAEDIVRPSLIPSVVAAIVFAAGIAALRTRTALSSVIALGAVGFGIALIYIWYSAPDLAITQVMIETLTTILLVLVLVRLPRFRRLSTRAARSRDTVLATSVGLLMAALLWMVMGMPSPADPISEWLLNEAVPSGYGRNVVNVILVDFRQLDTLGELFVLGLAAVGVYALLRRQAERGDSTP